MTGFLGTGAPLAVDLIVVGLSVVLPILFVSIALVRRGERAKHRAIQVAITASLALALIFFEIQVRSAGGWREMIADRGHSDSRITLIGVLLGVHLIFAVSTPLLWVAALMTSGKAWSGQRPRRHRLVARLAAGDLVLTALTGWLWYAVAFVA